MWSTRGIKRHDMLYKLWRLQAEGLL